MGHIEVGTDNSGMYSHLRVAEGKVEFRERLKAAVVLGCKLV